jgi:glycosyltransferase involved in cell wall biosynthesis
MPVAGRETEKPANAMLTGQARSDIIPQLPVFRHVPCFSRCFRRRGLSPAASNRKENCMNILVTYPWLDLGGAPNTSITLARGLKDLGHNVYFLTRSVGMYEKRLRDAGITVIDAPYGRFPPYMYHLNMKAHRILSRALDKYDIDIVHSFHPQSYILSLYSAPKRNIPVFLTAVWYLDDFPLPRYPARVLFVAEEFRDRAERWFGGRAGSVEIMPNRIDLGMFHPAIDSKVFSEEKGLPAGGWKIAFMSRIDRWKIGSLRNAVAAVKILAERGREVTLAIAGDGDMKGEIESLAREINDQAGRQVVVLLGPVIRTPEFLSWADVVFGIGRCAWEGMACGKPTVVVGENGFAGVADPSTVENLAYWNFAGRNRKDPAEPSLLADAVEGIMTDRTVYGDLSAFAREYVLERYDYRVGAKRLEELYLEAIDSPPLTAVQRFRTGITRCTLGYSRRFYIGCKLWLRGALRRGPYVKEHGKDA